MKLLIIDNNILPHFWGSPDLCYYVRSPGFTLHVRRGPQDDLPADPKKYDRILISGSLTSANDTSPWTHRLEDFIRRAVQEKIPMLGVCFGHQMIARSLGGADFVRKAQIPEFGWSQIDVKHPTPLFDGLPKSFHSYSSHFDEVSRLPKDFKLLASSEVCPIQAFEVDHLPVFGIQFHPERSFEQGQQAYLGHKKKGLHKYFLNYKRAEKLYSEAVAEKIFGNFLKISK